MENLANPMNQLKENLSFRWRYLIGLWVIVLLSTMYFFNYEGVPKKLIVLVGAIASVGIVLYGKSLEKNTFIIVVASGILFSFITPVIDVPDETAHLSRTMYISEGHLGVNKDISQLNISDDYKEIIGRNRENFRNDLKNVKHTENKSNQNNAVALTSIYSIVGYIPQTIGWTVGKLLNLNLYWSFYLGRVCNAIAYAFLAYFAVKIASRWKAFMAVITTFPMVVYLAASYSQDGVATGLIFLSIAYFINLTAKEEKINLKDVLIYLLLCVLIATCKLPYVLMAGFLVFLEPSRYASKKTYGLAILGVSLTALFTLYWYSSSTGIASYKPEGADPQKQIAFLMSEPDMIFKVSLDGIINVINKYLETFTFGWFSYGSNHVAILYLMFLSGVFLLFPVKKIRLTIYNKIGIIAVSMGIIAGIVMSQYLNWTPVKSEETNGVQGRYFIGLFALLPYFINVSSLFYNIESPDVLSNNQKLVEASNRREATTFELKQNLWLSSMSLYFLVLMIILTISIYYKG